MKVIICGAGQVGLGIAERLAAEGNDVSIIEQSPALVQRANDMLDVRAIQGNGAHPDVLFRAGAPNADMLIAVTLSDEVNMVACQIANSLLIRRESTMTLKNRFPSVVFLAPAGNQIRVY